MTLKSNNERSKVEHSKQRFKVENVTKTAVVLQSLPEEERDRVLTEEKMGGARLAGGLAASPHRAKSLSVKVKALFT